MTIPRRGVFELYKDHPTIPGYIRRGLAGESFWYTVQVGEAVYDTWLTPLRDAGPWQEAPDCSQIPTVARLAEMAAPEPLLEPRVTRSVS